MKKNTLNNINELISDFSKKTSTIINELNLESDKLMHVCNEVGKSWSGSFVGYHGQLYFQGFGIPKHNERFSGEWGGINGIPKGWEKTDETLVKKEIENRISKDFSIDKIEQEEKKLKKKVEALQHEIVIALAGINLDDFPKEKDLFNKIEEYEFGKGKAYFIDSMIPNQLMSRDQEALMQGTCIPAHVYFLGLSQGIKDTCESINSFLKLTDRLIRQLQIKKFKPFRTPKNLWNWVNPFWLILQLVLVIFHLLKLAWKHKLISAIFILISLFAIDYALAWKNLLTFVNWFKDM